MRLAISCQDRLGIAQDVLDILVHNAIDLRGIELDPKGKMFLNFPTVAFEDLQAIMPSIRRIEGVEDVKTTLFMPMEREQNQLRALLHSLPDPVFSIDTNAKIVLVNQAASRYAEKDSDALLGRDLSTLLKGFSLSKWFDQDAMGLEHKRVAFKGQDFLAEFMPVYVPEGEGEPILAGALVMLKSATRLGQQLNIYHQNSEDGFDKIVARTALMKRVVSDARQMAQLNGPILLFGETGSGKEMFARACHQSSNRSEAEFVALNCAAIPDNVAETELFGYGPGAFGQNNSKPGLFEMAKGGTLFLDEVADMSPHLQAKLLRVLEDGSYRRIGDGKALTTDVRFICSTQKDLATLVQQGQFRQDLYYRLNVLSLTIPPLRSRKADIPVLAETFIRQHSSRLGKCPPSMSKACQEAIVSYSWPGNVRQLENALYRAVSLVDGDCLDKGSLQLPLTPAPTHLVALNETDSLEEQVKAFEKHLLQSLYPSYPSTRQLAKRLGLSHTAIANKLREYGITKQTAKG